jgi:hypothetical protein
MYLVECEELLLVIVLVTMMQKQPMCVSFESDETAMGIAVGTVDQRHDVVLVQTTAFSATRFA